MRIALVAFSLLLPSLFGGCHMAQVATVAPSPASQCERVPTPLVLQLAFAAAREDLAPREVASVLVMLSESSDHEFEPSLTTPPVWADREGEADRCFWVGQSGRQHSEIPGCRPSETPDAAIGVRARTNCSSGSFALKFQAPQTREEIEDAAITGRQFHIWLDGYLGSPVVLLGGCYPALAEVKLPASELRIEQGVVIGTRCRPVM